VLIYDPLTFQRIDHPLHRGQCPLLLQSKRYAAHDLHRTGQPLHRFSVVVFVCALDSAICSFEVSGQSIEDLVHFRHRDDTGGVIEKVEEESVPAAADGIVHRIMRQRRRRVRRAEKQIKRLFWLSQPLEPGTLEGFSFRDPLPVLVRGELAHIAEQRGPDGVALDVAYVEVVGVLEDAGQTGSVEVELACAAVDPLESAEEGFICLAAIGAEEGRCYAEAVEWLARCRKLVLDLDAFVAGSFQSGDGEVEGAGDGGRGRDDVVGAHNTNTKSRFVEDLVVEILTPFKIGVDGVVDFPGFHLNEGLGEMG